MRSIAPLTKLIASTALITVGMIPATATAANVPTPPESGCPAAYCLLSLDDLEDQGHIFWPELDANADRYICGKPVAPKIQEQVCATIPGGCTVETIYYLRDNNVTRH